jgi:hypothetical protein
MSGDKELVFALDNNPLDRYLECMDFTNEQAKRIQDALHAYALDCGVTEQELRESANSLGEGQALAKHIARVSRALRCSYQSLSGATQNVLECCRYVAGALAWTCNPWQWDELDRKIWRLAQEATR